MRDIFRTPGSGGARRRVMRLFSPSCILRALACSAGVWFTGVAAASAGPVILSYPFTGRPGDVITLAGSGFGAAPKVYLKAAHLAAAVALATKTADDSTVVVELPKTSNPDLYDIWISNGAETSPHIVLNAPKPQHFDNAEIAPGAHFRVFGRNLLINLPPTVSLIDAQTNAQLKATVTLTTSTPYHLDIVAPAGVLAGHAYQANVSNGYATALTDSTILGHAAAVDKFQIGQPGPSISSMPTVRPTRRASREPIRRIITSSTSRRIQASRPSPRATARRMIRRRSRPRSISPEPTAAWFFCRPVRNVGTTAISLRSNVVLQGASAATTKILMRPPGGGFYIPPGAQMVGIADLSIQNTDLTSAYFINMGTSNQAVSKVFLQRVNWTLGSGKGLSLAGDRIAILNSTFTQTINYQNGDASQKTGGMGPFYLGPVSNLQFRNNAVKWATDQNSIHDAVNAVIENNTFTRSASDALTVGPAELLWSQASWNNFRLGDKIMRVMGRQLAINFARNAVVQYNTFGVSDGALKYNWNDGETIQNEAGGPNSREDAGTVTAADGSSISDDSKCAGPCVWKYTPAYSMVVVVSGAGAGQWRRITAQAGNKFTVDRPFDVVPAPGDHFTVSYPAYENAIIRGNRMSGNPKGIDLYHGAMLNVSIVGNTLTNNGGIDIIGTQRNLVDSAAAKLTNFSVSRNIEIIGNTISNTTGAFPAYIVVGGFQQCWQPTFWGKSAIGVEVRNNQLIARTGTFPFPYSEGFQAFALYQYPGAPYIDQGVGPLVGTVFQGNKCSNCPASYTLSTGAVNTTIWNATTVTSPGLASKFLNDYAFIPTTRTTSIRTVSGQD